ncbi:unnamed protein product [Nesidiocoris tenuis]|uniref:Uncharacterized protein n=1 Tax=Nesidiocoris tenuis TaxID=355587 RepID=A0A6H5GHT4_9HEMI|nr:unnamed protein product [Nesidiocoris tenuis]
MEVWDYIFLNGQFPKSSRIPRKTLESMRHEFLYWYPVDMRVSGKDLIQNHLTFFIYVHTALWSDPKMWPRSIRANGHLLLNSAKKIAETEDNYEKLQFKEALKTGFFELQAVRDKYRELSSNYGMHHDLVFKFIRVQALLMAPVCPHIAEHVYSLLGEGSILAAKWPETSAIDLGLIKSSAYLMDAAHEFRLQLKNLMAQGKKGKVAQEKPTQAVIWVAKSYPKWQELILTKLKEMYLLEDLRISYTDAGDAPEKVKLETTPGTPFITFPPPLPGVKLKLINPQPQSGMFSESVIVQDKMPLRNLTNLLRKKQDGKIEFWRWKDPELGPRKIPNCEDCTAGKIKIDVDSEFLVDMERQQISIKDRTGVHPIGTQITYLILR